jgi:hypothetical protein
VLQLPCERTSRFNSRSCTRLMIWAIVTSLPPSPRDGCANCIFFPSRKRPRASSKLLMYSEAVFRLNVPSMAALECCQGGRGCDTQTLFREHCKQDPKTRLVRPPFRQARKGRPWPTHTSEKLSRLLLTDGESQAKVSAARPAGLKFVGLPSASCVTGRRKREVNSKLFEGVELHDYLRSKTCFNWTLSRSF